MEMEAGQLNLTLRHQLRNSKILSMCHPVENILQLKVYSTLRCAQRIAKYKAENRVQKIENTNR